jgi:DNA-binding response OmpR family regulator
MKVLIADDDVDILATVADQCELQDILCDCAANGGQVLELYKRNNYEVIVLDVSMPGKSGLWACQQLRSIGCTTPIIFLTARDTLDDRLTGFSAGADDYLVKPFFMQELICRLYALGRRSSKQNARQIECGPLLLDLDQQAAWREGVQLNITDAQFKILKLLALRAPKVVTREELEDELWFDEAPDSDALRSHLYQLRLALDRPHEIKMLNTLRNRGYQLLYERSVSCA